MPARHEALFDQLRAWAESHGIAVSEQPLGAETPGRFDGPTVTMNERYDPAERAWYFAHALGSIVRWSQSPDECDTLFERLDDAKARRKQNPSRLEFELSDYRVYESDASEYAVWLLKELGFEDLIPAYTKFARADLEIMTLHHRNGTAPPWREFFAEWNRDVAAGRRKVEPYRLKPIPPFHPVKMREQKILQEG
jgi:hypothetical protein